MKKLSANMIPKEYENFNNWGTYIYSCNGDLTPVAPPQIILVASGFFASGYSSTFTLRGRKVHRCQVAPTFLCLRVFHLVMVAFEEAKSESVPYHPWDRFLLSHEWFIFDGKLVDLVGTLPKTNIALEKWWLGNYFPFGKPYFQV